MVGRPAPVSLLVYIKPTPGRDWGQLLGHLHSRQGPSYPQTLDASRRESRVGSQAPDRPRENESSDFLDCTLMDGLLSHLPVISPADREGRRGGAWKLGSAWNVVGVVGPTMRGPLRGNEKKMRMCLGPYGPCGSQKVGSWPGRVPFASPHQFSTFLDAASGFLVGAARGQHQQECLKARSGAFLLRASSWQGLCWPWLCFTLTCLPTVAPASSKGSLS